MPAIFGNRTAASVLLYLKNLESGYASRIAETYDMPVGIVQDQLAKLEVAGVLISQTVGHTRVFEFNPRNPTSKRIRGFLATELKALPDEITKKYFRQRRRTRRSGKRLERSTS